MEDRERSQEMPLIRLAAAMGFTAVACGALGAHAVKAWGPEALEWWNTGAKYHLAHALAIALIPALGPRLSKKAAITAAALFTLGIALFSGSLYALAATGARGLGAITPFGGLAFLAGWVALFVGAKR